ncbi:MAG: SH3 domain-containing protein [Clostridia bacterium]|nr:SH3 domain-containing protein [Clostridia bacterium]
MKNAKRLLCVLLILTLLTGATLPATATTVREATSRGVLVIPEGEEGDTIHVRKESKKDAVDIRLLKKDDPIDILRTVGEGDAKWYVIDVDGVDGFIFHEYVDHVTQIAKPPVATLDTGALKSLEEAAAALEAEKLAALEAEKLAAEAAAVADAVAAIAAEEAAKKALEEADAAFKVPAGGALTELGVPDIGLVTGFEAPTGEVAIEPESPMGETDGTSASEPPAGETGSDPVAEAAAQAVEDARAAAEAAKTAAEAVKSASGAPEAEAAALVAATAAAAAQAAADAAAATFVAAAAEEAAQYAAEAKAYAEQAAEEAAKKAAEATEPEAEDPGEGMLVVPMWAALPDATFDPPSTGAGVVSPFTPPPQSYYMIKPTADVLTIGLYKNGVIKPDGDTNPGWGDPSYFIDNVPEGTVARVYGVNDAVINPAPPPPGGLIGWAHVSVTIGSTTYEGFIWRGALVSTLPAPIGSHLAYVNTMDSAHRVFSDEALTTQVAAHNTGMKVDILRYIPSTNKVYVRITGNGTSPETHGYMSTDDLQAGAPASTEAVLAAADPWALVPMYLQPSTSGPFVTNLTIGVKVNVFYRGLDWSLVKTGTYQGYIQTKYLANSSTFGTGFLSNPMGSYTPLFHAGGAFEPPFSSYPNGTPVNILSIGPDWAYVEISGTVPPVRGYVYLSHLNYSGGVSYTTAVVNNPNPRDFLNLRAAPTKSSASIGRYYNGTIVDILQYGPEWCYVRVNGIIGYMMTYYLSFSGSYTPGPGGWSYATVNTISSRLNLRAAPTTASSSLGLYAKGTIVTILSYGPDWCHVKVGGVTGYMATRYLAFGTGGGTGGGVLRTAIVRNISAPGAILSDNAGNSLGYFANGTVVQILDYGISKHFVQIGALRGYIPASQLLLM